MEQPPPQIVKEAGSADRILDAAFELFCLRGYSGTAISAVVASSGLTASSIYNFFQSKHGLYAAVVERETRRWIRKLHDSAAPTADPRVALRVHLLHVTKLLDESPDFLRLLIMLSLERSAISDETLATIRDVRRQATIQLSETFEKHLESTRSDAPEIALKLVRMTMAFVEGLYLERAEDPDFRLSPYVDALSTGLEAILAAAVEGALFRSDPLSEPQQ